MFIASLDAKCIIPLLIWAGQDIFIHFTADSPSNLTVGSEQTGHLSGILNSTSSPVRSSFITSSTWGIISPAFWTNTVSLIFISFSFI